MEANSKYSGNVRRVSVLSARRQRASGRSSRPTSVNKDGRPHDDNDDGHVKVAVRCRPMSDKELNAGHEPIVEFESIQRIVVHDVSEQPSDQLGTNSGERRNISHVYDFDHVFDCQSKQQDIYDQVCRPIVDSVLEGYNGTIFAYGQTGTGKTYTMKGLNEQLRRSSYHNQQRRDSKSGELSRKNSQRDTTSDRRQEQQQLGQTDKNQAGIMPRAFEQIFDHVQRHPEIQFLIRASYSEVYQEEIRDLLRKDSKNKLELHERPDIGVYVKDLTSFVCKSMSEIERVMRVGNQNRSVGATDMNEHSSRSHAIFTVTVEQQQQQLETKLQQEESDRTLEGSHNETFEGPKRANASQPVIRVGKLNLVDLAGSERQRKTNSSGQRQKESIKINLSLSALGNVINSLMKVQQQREQQQQQQVVYGGSLKPTSQALIHTPYRDSKLTRLLQDSLGGNAKTLMIANIGPASYNYDETINTLNYASRARCIKNRPRVNEDPKDALLRQLQKEIELLRAKLANQIGPNGDGGADQSTTVTSDNQSSGVSSAKSSRGSSGATNGDSNLVHGKRLSLSSMSGADDDGENNDTKRQLVEREFFELKQKLASLESKLLNSDKSDRIVLSSSPTSRQLLDHQSILKGLTETQRVELERRRKELADQVSRERAIRDELERREEAELIAKQSFESIQQEIEAKRRLIWQVLLKVKSIRDEMSSIQQAYRIELDELEQLQIVLQRELKLKCLIMDNFIPNEHVDQLIARVNYDERRNMCSIRPLELATNSQGGCVISNGVESKAGDNLFDYLRHLLVATNSTRPRSELERLSGTINPSNIRYKSDDLIEPSLTFIDPSHSKGKGRTLRSP